MSIKRTPILLIASIILLLLLGLSGLNPFDRTTWLLEIFPVLIVLPVLWASYGRFPLTSLLYALIFCHAIVLIVGGAYSYARVPLGFEIAEWLHMTRNPYDKIGHFFQGFVPALVAREIFLRGRHLRAGKMLAFLSVCVVLAISATYELIEWAAAVGLGQGADEFLGTQGDPWDTQSDMGFALLGGLTSLLLLSRWHDRQLQACLGTRPAYVVGGISVSDAVKWDEYRAQVPQTLAPWGAELMFRAKHVATFAGDEAPPDLVVIRFPDTEAAKGWFASPAYQALLPLRQDAARVSLHCYA